MALSFHDRILKRWSRLPHDEKYAQAKALVESKRGKKYNSSAEADFMDTISRFYYSRLDAAGWANLLNSGQVSGDIAKRYSVDAKQDNSGNWFVPTGGSYTVGELGSTSSSNGTTLGGASGSGGTYGTMGVTGLTTGGIGGGGSGGGIGSVGGKSSSGGGKKTGGTTGNKAGATGGHTGGTSRANNSQNPAGGLLGWHAGGAGVTGPQGGFFNLGPQTGWFNNSPPPTYQGGGGGSSYRPPSGSSGGSSVGGGGSSGGGPTSSYGNITFSGGGTNIDRYLQQAEQARQQALAANEARYQQLLSGHSAREQNVLGRLDQTAANNINAQQGRLNNITNDWQQTTANAINSFNTQANEANNLAQSHEVPAAHQNRANLLNSRQQGIDNQYGQRANQIAGLYNGLGQQAARDIDEQFDQARGQTTSNLVMRGLYNTTLYDTAHRDVETQRSQAHRGLQDRLRQGQVGLQSYLTGNTLDSMQRGIGMDERTSLDAVQSGERRLDRSLGTLGDTRRGAAGIRSSYDMGRLQFLNQGQGQQTSLGEAVRTSDLQYRSLLPLGRLGTIEGRQDKYPNMTAITNLALQAGRGAAALPI